MLLIQATRNAMVNDLVVRNVADLAAVPTGKPGRPSESLNLDQAVAVLAAGETKTEKVAARVPDLRYCRGGAAIALGPLFESRGKTNGGQN